MTMWMQSCAELRSCPGRSAARSDELQSRGPFVRIVPCGLLGPGSAERHCVPHRVRDTREADVVTPHSVIASAAKQSTNVSAERLWIASAFAKASADKSLRSQ